MDRPMHRKDLLQKLESYWPDDNREAESLRQILLFVEAHPDCFKRSALPGHVTGSAWLLDHSGDRVLLTHHRKLEKWIQLGGHSDGESQVLEVALREAREESGIEAIVPVSEQIFDVDVHWIPKRHDEPGHYHYDIRFLLQVGGESRFQVSDESINLAWVHRDELPGLALEESVLRMYRKWLKRGS